MCVEAEGCSKDSYSSVGGGNFRGVCPCPSQLKVKETGLSGAKTGQAEISWRRLPRTTNGRMEIGLCWTAGSRALLTACAPKGFYAGLHAEKTSGLIYAE